MRSYFTAMALAVASLTASAVTGGGDAPVPVNVIAESGTDVGPCATGGTLSYPPAPYKGSAYFLLKADRTLAARHEALTGQRPSWLRNLDGPSGTTRLFTSPGGDRVIVFWACKEKDCAANTAYGAYGMQTSEYALQTQAPGEPTELGSPSPMLAAAIACARAHDDRQRSRATEELKKQTGR